MERYGDFKYKIIRRPDGRYDFLVWRAGENSRREDPTYVHTVKTRADAERVVKRWIDDRQPKRRKRPRAKGRR